MTFKLEIMKIITNQRLQNIIYIRRHDTKLRAATKMAVLDDS